MSTAAPRPSAIAALWAVYRKELFVLFFSPLAWVFLGAFLFLGGVFFYVGLVGSGEASLRSVMANLGVVLLFCLPMLTMRQFAEESRAGTLELLMTAPVPLTSLILGKWLAALTLCVALLVLTVPYPITLFVYGEPDPGALVTSYLGLFACCAAFSAAGLFTSSLARDQMVAGVVGILVLLPFWVAGAARGLLGDPPTTEAETWAEWLMHGARAGLDYVLEGMSFVDHLRSFARGVLDTGDIVWFTGFTLAFLFLTWVSLESRRWR